MCVNWWPTWRTLSSTTFLSVRQVVTNLTHTFFYKMFVLSVRQVVTNLTHTFFYKIFIWSVRQFGRLPELYEDARSEKYKKNNTTSRPPGWTSNEMGTAYYQATNSRSFLIFLIFNNISPSYCDIHDCIVGCLWIMSEKWRERRQCGCWLQLQKAAEVSVNFATSICNACVTFSEIVRS